ncbi:MAG: adenylate/guanylate cyclase domain-containing protein [Chloroflexota bacterium]
MPPGGAQVEIAVLFVDVRGSTQLGERMEPTAYATLLNRFYQVTTEVLLAHGAIVDKMIGDEVMALFIPGICGPDYRRHAVDAGAALLKAMNCGRDRAPWLTVGVAVHAGPAFVGNVGHAGISDFTALGDTVNTAARLQGAAEACTMVISEDIYALVERGFPGLERRVLTLRGRAEPQMARIFAVPSNPTT